MDQPLLIAASGEEEDSGRPRREEEWWWSSSTSSSDPNDRAGRRAALRSFPQQEVQEDSNNDDPWRSNGTCRRASDDEFRRNRNVEDNDSIFEGRALRHERQGGGRTNNNGNESRLARQEQHRLVLFQLYRVILVLGWIVNAMGGTILLVAFVVTMVRSNAMSNGNLLHDFVGGARPPRTSALALRERSNSSSPSNGTDDGSRSNGSGDEELGVAWMWLVSSLAAAHWALLAATSFALSCSSSGNEEDRRESDDNPNEGGEATVVEGAYEIVNLGEALNGGDDDEHWCCCCGGRWQKQLCGSSITAYLSAVLSLVYVTLSSMVDLNVVSCGRECGSALLLLPDVAKIHLGMALLGMAVFHAVQARAAFGYRHQLQLLINEVTTASAASRRRRRRATRRPWWWQSSSSGNINRGATDSDGRDGCDNGPDRGENEGGWFGWVRRQGRKPNPSATAPRLSFFRSTHNFRDDGSVDFASVQEDWMNRSMEDPHWWSRDEEPLPSPSPRRRKDWDEQDERLLS
jgi:hypothetical protein